MSKDDTSFIFLPAIPKEFLCLLHGKSLINVGYMNK